MPCFNLLDSIEFHRSCAGTPKINPLLEAVTLMGGKPLQSHIDHVTPLGTGGQHSRWRDADSHTGCGGRSSAAPLSFTAVQRKQRGGSHEASGTLHHHFLPMV